MRLIVGLGNPGRHYESTRHNVGFRVVDHFAAQARIPFVEGRGDFFVARCDIDDVPVALIKPTTFMNQSGVAVEQAVDLFGSAYSETLIVYDDFQIPLGTLRFRPGGSDGGHHGISSVIYHAGSDQIPRLRCGIGRPDADGQEIESVSFVLAPFEMTEERVVRSMIERASDGIGLYLREGMQAAMNEFNRSPDHNG